MAARTKQKAPAKKPTGTVRAGKATAGRTVGGSSGKKTLRGSNVTKPTTKKTTAAGKSAGRKPTAGKKTPAAAKSAKKASPAAKTKGEGDRLQELRKLLIGKKEAIVREAKNEIAKYISGENRQLVETALDEGDWAVVDISEDINLRMLAAHRRSLHDIDESLRKIKEGSYGICEECGEEIAQKRLQVLPTATLCVTCQGLKERLEAIEKEEPAV